MPGDGGEVDRKAAVADSGDPGESDAWKTGKAGRLSQDGSRRRQGSDGIRHGDGCGGSGSDSERHTATQYPDVLIQERRMCSDFSSTEAKAVGGDLCVIEPGQAELKKTAEQSAGAKYLTDIEGMFQYFKRADRRYSYRENKKKRGFIDEGLDEDEIYQRMKAERPVFIFPE